VCACEYTYLCTYIYVRQTIISIIQTYEYVTEIISVHLCAVEILWCVLLLLPHTHINTHTHTYTHTHTHTHTHTRSHTYTHKYTNTYTYTHTHTHTHTRTHTLSLLHTHTHTQKYTHPPSLTPTHTHTNTGCGWCMGNTGRQRRAGCTRSTRASRRDWLFCG